jgi:hypothetical protein
MINKQRLNFSLTTIHEDESGRLYSSGHFIDLTNDLRDNVATGSENFRSLANYFNYVHQDVWNLETITLRMEWQKGLILRGELNDLLGAQFAACDIDLFHVQYRSLFDHLAKIIGILSGRPSTVPDSFRKLRDWVSRSENSNRIDDDLAGVVASCDWFNDMREVRDSIVHRDGRTLVFPEENRILFQVHEGFRNKVNIPEIMFNENIVDFELYAGLLAGYLIAYLEDVSKIAQRKLELRKIGWNAKSYHGGLRVIHDWIERVCAI